MILVSWRADLYTLVKVRLRLIFQKRRGAAGLGRIWKRNQLSQNRRLLTCEEDYPNFGQGAKVQEFHQTSYQAKTIRDEVCFENGITPVIDEGCALAKMSI